MPDTGTLDRTTVVAGNVPEKPEPIVLEDARWLQITFEVPRRAALEALPADVSRPIPCYGRLLIAAGHLDREPASFAALAVGGRFMLMPRNVLAAGVASVDRIAGTFSNGMQAGATSIEREGQRITGTVSSAMGELATAVLPAAYAIEPSMLRWDPWLAIANHDGEPVLTEILVTPEIELAMLSKGAALQPTDVVPRNHPFRALRNLLTISSCYAEGTLTFSEPRILRECS